MLGSLEGSPEEKLAHAEAIMTTIVEHASCRLSDDQTRILCQARRIDGELQVEELSTALLPSECVRHAAMRLGKATHPPERISDWERWASAWHAIQTHGAGALSYAERQIEMLDADGALSGVVVWEDIRRRIAVLQAEPEAWAGRA